MKLNKRSKKGKYTIEPIYTYPLTFVINRMTGKLEISVANNEMEPVESEDDDSQSHEKKHRMDEGKEDEKEPEEREEGDADDDDAEDGDNYDDDEAEEGEGGEEGKDGLADMMSRILNQQVVSALPVLSKRKTALMKGILKRCT